MTTWRNVPHKKIKESCTLHKLNIENLLQKYNNITEHW